MGSIGSINSTALDESGMASSINSRPAKLNNYLNGRNAVISRLLTCMVNEQLVEAYIVTPSAEIAEKNLLWCQVVKIGSISDVQDRCFWIGLRNRPLILPSNGKLKVALLDPEDFGYPVICVNSESSEVVELTDPSVLMETMSEWHIFDTNILDELKQELVSSVEHQDYAYLHRPIDPHLGDPGIAWEQSIVEGHPTHPMNKSRHAVPPIKPISPEMDFNTPTIHFFAVPHSEMIISGNYEKLMQPLWQGRSLDLDFENETIIPVHEIQIPNILEKFPFARQLNFTESALAQCSLRTVLVPKLPGLILKLSIGIKITSAMRTITPGTAKLSPTLKSVMDAVIDDKDNLIVLNELGSITSRHPDSDTAKHLSCMVREDADTLCGALGEIVIVCAALTEKDVNGEFAMVRAFNLDTAVKRLNFFGKYAKLFLKAFLTPIYKYGYAFEAHLQNTIARFKKDENGIYNLTGFAIRDFGAVCVLQKQLKDVTGIDMDFGASRNANNVEEIHRVGFHTMIQMHLHRVIRALDLHYCGTGWTVVRNELDAILPQNCITRKLWLESETSDYKCFITMKLCGLYADYLYCKVPNLIVYSPEENNNAIS